MKLSNESKITWLTNVGAGSENYFQCFLKNTTFFFQRMIITIPIC